MPHPSIAVLAFVLFAFGHIVAGSASAEPIRVMILGSYHMNNPGQDEANIAADDVLAPKRQAELETVARQLAAFRPTKIAVERVASPPNFVWSASIDPERLVTARGEVHQIGERLAVLAGVKQLHGIDAPGDFDLSSIRALDQRVTGGTRIRAWDLRLKDFADKMQRKLGELSVGGYLAWLNSPEVINENHALYPALFDIAEGDEQPAAQLATDWYARNARIWGKLCQIAEPGDRIVVVFGAGHAYWLRQHAAQTPGYELVEPGLFLAP